MPHPCNRRIRRTAAIAPTGHHYLSRPALRWKKLLLAVLVFLMPAVSWALPRIAVVDFDTNKYSSQIAGDQLADYVIDELVNTGLFEVVEREKMSSITRELGFGASGLVDPSSAAQMGRLAGARLLMTGRVISLGQEEKTFSGYGVQSRSTVLSLSVSVRIVDTESGSIAFSTRTTTHRTITETGGMNVRTNTAYGALAEQAANELVGEITRSGRFEQRTAHQDASAAINLVGVEVSSTPLSADVEVDGIFYGNAGGTLQLPQGLRTVRISLAGYQPWEKKVMINPGTVINATLAPSPE